MRNVAYRIRRAILFSAIALAATACDNDDDPLAPFDPVVTNTTDSFRLQSTGTETVRRIITYDWQNTGTQATITQSATFTSGSARVTIRDVTGTQVYHRSLSESGTFTTAVGRAGNWQIQFELTDAAGTIDFRAVRRP